MSNTISYDKFDETYLIHEKATVTETGNGNWLQVVDNDGDNVAEYVLLVEYALDTIIESRNDKLYYRSLDIEKITPVGVEGYTQTLGDIVLYAVIDGKAYVHKADTATATFKAVNYKERTATTTDGEVKEQSDIDNHTTLPGTLTDVDELTSYNMYLDDYGFVRAYDNKVSYALLTEMYPTSDWNSAWVVNRELTAEAMLAGDTAVREYKVVNSTYNGAANSFFTTINGGWSYPGITNIRYNNYQYTDKLNYLQPATHMLGVANKQGFVFDYSKHDLYVADGTDVAKDANGNPLWPNFNYNSWTNVAKYTQTSDGLNLYTAAGTSNNVTTDYIRLNSSVTALNTINRNNPLFTIEDQYYDEVYTSADSHYVRAVDSTVFFLVTVSKNGTTQAIRQYTGYGNVPTLNNENNVRSMYAVAHTNTPNDVNVNARNYWVADVIVIEMYDYNAYESISLIYSNNYKNQGDVKYVEAIDSVKGEIRIIPNNYNVWNGRFEGYGFYGLNNLVAVEGETNTYTADITHITDNELTNDLGTYNDNNYNKNGIYYGQVRSLWSEDGYSNYITLDVLDHNGLVVGTKDVRVTLGAWGIKDNDTYNSAVPLLLKSTTVNNKVETGDKVIWVETSGAGEARTAGFLIDLTDTDMNLWNVSGVNKRSWNPTPDFLWTESARLGRAQWTGKDIDDVKSWNYEEIIGKRNDQSSQTRTAAPQDGFVLDSYDIFLGSNIDAEIPVYSGVMDDGLWHIRYNIPEGSVVNVRVARNDLMRKDLVLNSDVLKGTVTSTKTNAYGNVIPGTGIDVFRAENWSFTMPALTVGQKVIGTIFEDTTTIPSGAIYGASGSYRVTLGSVTVGGTVDPGKVEYDVTFEITGADVIVNGNPAANGKYEKDTVLNVKVTPNPETNKIITVTVNGAAVAPEADGSYKITVDGNKEIKITATAEPIETEKAVFTLGTASEGAAEWFWDDPTSASPNKVNVALKIAEGAEYAVGARIAVDDFINLPEKPTTGDDAATDWDVEFIPSTAAHYDYATDEIVVDEAGSIQVVAKCYDQKWNADITIGGEPGGSETPDDEYEGGIGTNPPAGVERMARVLSRPAPGSKVTFWTQQWIPDTRELSRIVCNGVELTENDWTIHDGKGEYAGKFVVEFEVPFTTGNYDIHIYLKAAAAYTVTLEKDTASRRNITALPASASAKADGTCSFDVTVAKYYEPRAAVTKADGTTAFDPAVKITYTAKNTDKTEWTVTITGITADAKAVVSAVKNVVVTLKGTEDEATPATAEATVNGDVATFTVTMADGTHYPKVTGAPALTASNKVTYERGTGTNEWVVTVTGINASVEITVANSDSELNTVAFTSVSGGLVVIPAGASPVTANPDGTFKIEGVKVDSAYVPGLEGWSTSNSAAAKDTVAFKDLKAEKVGETYTLTGKLDMSSTGFSDKSDFTVKVSAASSQTINMTLADNSVVAAAAAEIQGEAMQAVQGGKVKYTVVTNEGYYPTISTSAPHDDILTDTPVFNISGETANGKTTWTVEIAVKASGNLTMNCVALPMVRLDTPLPAGVTADVVAKSAVPKFDKDADSTNPSGYTVEFAVKADADKDIRPTVTGSSWAIDGTPTYKDGVWTIKAKLDNSTAASGTISIPNPETKKSATLIADGEIASIKGDATKYDNGENMKFTVLVDETYDLDEAKFVTADATGAEASATITVAKGEKDEETGKIAWTVTVGAGLRSEVVITLATKAIDGAVVVLNSNGSSELYTPTTQYTTSTGRVEALIYVTNNKMLKADGAEVVSIEENTTADVRVGMTAYDVVMNVTGKGIVNVTLTAESSVFGEKVGVTVAGADYTGVTATDADPANGDWLGHKTVELAKTVTATEVAGSSPASYTVQFAVEALGGYTVVVSGEGYTVSKGAYTGGANATEGYTVWIVTWTGTGDDVEGDTHTLKTAGTVSVGAIIE